MDVEPLQIRCIRNLIRLPKTEQSSQRLAIVKSLRAQISSIYGEERAALATLVVHSLSQLFSHDQINHEEEVASWSRHPSHSEPLLEQLLKLLLESVAHYHPSSLPNWNPPIDSVVSIASIVLTDEEKRSINQLPELPDTLFPSDIIQRSLLYRIQHSFSSTSRQYLFSTAHLIQILSVLTSEKSISLSRLALYSQAALCRVLEPDVVASFLPGLVSTYSKLLHKSALFHSSVVVACLDALYTVIYRAFPLREHDPRKRRTVLDLTREISNEDSVTPSSHVTKRGKLKDEIPRLETERNEVWIQLASSECSLRLLHILKSSDGPLKHSSPQVLSYLAGFIGNLLHSETGLLLPSPVSLMLKYICILICGDEFPFVCDAARGVVSALMRQNVIERWEIEHGIRAIIRLRGFSNDLWSNDDKTTSSSGSKSSSNKLQSVEDMEDSLMKDFTSSMDDVWPRFGRGFISLMFPGTSVDASISGHSSRSVIDMNVLPQSILHVGQKVFCRLLVEVHRESFEILGESDEATEKAIDNIALRSSAYFGKHGLLQHLFSSLLLECEFEEDSLGDLVDSDIDISSFRHLSSFKERAYTVLVLLSMIRGAVMQEKVGKEETNSHNRYLYQCTKEALQSMKDFFVPTMERLIDTGQTGSVDDRIIGLKRCILLMSCRLLEDLGMHFRRTCWRPLGGDMVLVVVMPLLLDAADGEESIRDCAKSVLVRIAKATGAESERQMLLRHVNFCVGRVVRNLDAPWAAHVLSFIIGKDGDEVSRESTVLLTATLRHMNDGLAAGSDTAVLKMLSSIDNVLSTAVLQKEQESRTALVDGREGENDDWKRIQSGRVQNEKAVLRKRLLSFCTEEVNDYEEMTRMTEVNEGHGDIAFGDYENEECEESVFETIAMSTLDGVRDVLFGRPWNVRASALRCATLSVRVLEEKWKQLLPHAAKLLPLLPEQFVVLNEELSAGERMFRSFKARKAGGDGGDIADLVAFINRKGRELPVVTNACLLLAALGKYGGSFIQERFVRLIYPKLRALLRVAQHFPTLLQKNEKSDEQPGYGGMSAADACLEAIAEVAKVAPKVLKAHTASLMGYMGVYLDERNNAEHVPRIKSAHVNRGMVRFEVERWKRRKGWCEEIVKGLRKVNGTDVMIGLLVNERQRSQYRDVVVRGSSSEMESLRVR